MKEASPHIATPTVQNRLQPFFQRSAEEGKEDSAFFSGVQAKLNVGQKDDAYEKEADSMADKVVNRSASNGDAIASHADNSISTLRRKTNPVAQALVYSDTSTLSSGDQQEEKKEEKNEPGIETSIQKSPVADEGQTNPSIQRMCRECDEGDVIYRSTDDSPDVTGMSKGEAVIAMAKTMLGKIKAKQTQGAQRYGGDQLWEIFKLAAPGVWSEDVVRNPGPGLPSWCGIFAVWAHKKAGIDLGNWQMGKGVSAFDTLKQTSSPAPGDIGYIDQPFQHHCIVTKVNGANIESIDGNSGLFSEVIENVRPKTAYTGFFTAFSGGTGSSVSKKEINGSLQKSENGTATQAPSSVETSLASSKGGGSGLPEKTRSEMESGFGADFSNVKIHTNSNAVEMNKQLNAQAFTHGGDVYFSENKYNPDTSSGKHLLAHELTHTVQQGAAGVQKKSNGSNLPKISKKIQRALRDETDALAVGDVYEINFKNTKKRHTLDRGKKILEMPEITLPRLKERNQEKYKYPIHSIRGRGETLQVQNWENAVRSAVDAKVYDFLKKDNSTPGKDMKPSDILYYKLKSRPDFHIIGDAKAIQALSYIPRWGRDGQPVFHQVDHVVEFQLGGEDQPQTKPTNYELLQAKANMSSGNAIRKQRYDRVSESLAYFKELHKDSKSTVYKKFTWLPTQEKVLDEWESQFQKVDKWDLPCNGDGNIYWTYEELTKRKTSDKDKDPLDSLQKMSAAEIAAVSGTSTDILVYAGQSVGGSKTLKMPHVAGTEIKDFFLGMNLTDATLSGTAAGPGQKAGTVKFKLNRDFTKKLKASDDDKDKLEFDLIAVPDGRANTYYIQSNAQFNRNMFRKFEGLSPVTVNDIVVDAFKGIMVTGNITCTAPLIKELSIDFWITGEEMGFSTMIDAGVIKKGFPQPFEVTSVDLEISYSSKNPDTISLLGNLAFQIEKLGSGKLTGGKKGKGLYVFGDFNFDKSLFDGKVGFSYENDEWAISGSGTFDTKKLKAIKSGTIAFDYKNRVLKAGGTAQLTVPGIPSVKIDSEIGKDGHFVIEAGVELGKVPKIKGGQGTLRISKDAPLPATAGEKGDANTPAQEGEWDLTITGKVMPDLNYSGLKLNEVDIYYGNGAFDFNAEAQYDRNRISGDFKVGLTNKPVTADGKLGSGEATDKMTFYGELELTVIILDGENKVGGKIKSVIKPGGDITLDGTIQPDKDIEVFTVKPYNYQVFKLDENIPLASCVVAKLSLHVGGAVDLYAQLKPLTVKKESNLKIGNLSLKDYKNPEITSNIILNSNLKAGAKLALEVGLDASLLGVLHAQVNGTGTLDFVALDADATGNIDLGWSPAEGFKVNEASVSLEMTSKLIAELGANAKVFADLWVTTIDIWHHEWNFAKEEFPIELFDSQKKTISLAGGNKKLGSANMSDNLSDLKKAATPGKVKEKTQNTLDGKKGDAVVDKQAEANEVIKNAVLANFRHPKPLVFNQSNNYLETRYGLYNYLKKKVGLDPKIDLTYIDEEIKKAEHEEYDAFSIYIVNEKDFDDNSKATIIADFIINHPTLSSTEIANLKNLLPVKIPKSNLPSIKSRASKIPKQTDDSNTGKKPIQKKAKGGGSLKGKKTVQQNKVGNKSDLTSTSYNTGDANKTIYGEDIFLETNAVFKNERREVGEEREPSEAVELEEMGGFIDEPLNEPNNKSFYMRPFTRTRKPLQQRASEKNQSPFFSGPQKKEKTNGTAFFQAKLSVGEANDPLEKEADKVADAVTGKGEKKEDRKDDIAKGAGVGKPEQEANKGKSPGADKPPMQEEKKPKEAAQKKSKGTDEKEEKDKKIDKKDNRSNATPAKGKSAEASIANKNGRGSGLPANTLNDMQSSFGKDFTDVRIHTDSEAAEISDELDAQAFTTGKDIYFNSGKFDPESESGKHLLAHELAHVVQQNRDTIRRDPKSEKEEKTRAQKVRDNYQKALHSKSVNWEEVASYFNAFNEAEQRSKMAQLNGNQLFQLHQGAVYAPGGGPRCAAALITTPVPGMDSSIAASIEEQILQYNYQQAIDLMTDYLDKAGVIDRTLLSGGKFTYLAKEHMSGEGRVVAPGFDQATGKAKPTSSNISSDAFGQSKGLPFLYSTLIHEFQHVHQMQKKDESKALIPDQGNDESTHLQQEVEAYGTELAQARESGLFNNPEEMDNTWSRLQQRWQELTEDRKKPLNDLYKKAYSVVKEALGKKSFLVYTPVK